MLDNISYKNRTKINHITCEHIYGDASVVKRILNTYGDLKGCAVREGNIEILDIILDIESAIKKCNFTEQQMERLKLWMDGYTETEIAKLAGVNTSVIHKFISKASIKISVKLV